MSGWIILAVGVAVALVDFMVGRHFAGMDAARLKPAAGGGAAPVEQVRRLGRILMMVSPLFFILFAAIAFGVIPIGGVEPVSFN